MLVNNFDGDLLGLEGALAPGLAEQPLAQEQAEVDAGQWKFGGELVEEARFARARGARDDGEFVVGALGGADGVKELGKGDVVGHGASPLGVRQMGAELAMRKRFSAG